MGYIATPKGIDFTIQSPPLTDEERKAISEFIKQSKARNRLKNKKEENKEILHNF